MWAILVYAQPPRSGGEFPYRFADAGAPFRLLIYLQLAVWTVWAWQTLRQRRCDGHGLDD